SSREPSPKLQGFLLAVEAFAAGLNYLSVGHIIGEPEGCAVGVRQPNGDDETIRVFLANALGDPFGQHRLQRLVRQLRLLIRQECGSAIFSVAAKYDEEGGILKIRWRSSDGLDGMDVHWTKNVDRDAASKNMA